MKFNLLLAKKLSLHMSVFSFLLLIWMPSTINQVLKTKITQCYKLNFNLLMSHMWLKTIGLEVIGHVNGHMWVWLELYSNFDLCFNLREFFF